MLRKKLIKPIGILSTITLFAFIFCMFHILQPNKEIELGTQCTFETGGKVEDAVIQTGISLKPGVYCVRLQYNGEGNALTPLGHTYLRDTMLSSSKVLNNGEHLYTELHSTEYYLWVYQATDSLEMVLSYGGEGTLEITGCVIQETNQLWYMLLTITLFIAFIFMLTIIFYYNNQLNSTFFWLVLIGLVASIPYLCNYNVAGIDLTYHLHRIEGIKAGLLGGQFPVRIEPKWLFDHGYGAALFYCNGLLYFPAILRMLGFPLYICYNLYCIALNIATVGIAYYCFCKIFQDRTAGIICSALYTLSTFRIYKLVCTSATGEGSAFTFMPLVLYGMYRVFTEDEKDKRYKTAWIPLAIGYAGLLQTHILTCEITALVTFIACLVCIRKIFRKNTFVQLAKGALGAMGLSLWFVVPFVDYYLTQDVHIKNLSARTIQQSGMTLAHIALQFWREGTYTPDRGQGVYETYPVGVGFILALGLLFFMILVYIGELRGKKDARISLARFAAIMSVLLLFMSTNMFPWDYLRSLNPISAALVSSLEFPHRVLGWGTLFLTAVAGFLVWYLKKKRKVYYVTALAVTAICIITSSLYLTDRGMKNWTHYQIYSEEGMMYGFISDGEYLLEGTDAGLISFATYEAGENVVVSSYTKKSLQIDIAASNEGAEGYVDLPLLYYRDYRAIDSDTGEKLMTCPGENNMVRVIIPENYIGNIRVDFVSPIYWRISEIISVVCYIGLFIIGIRKVRDRSICGCRY